MGLKHNLRGALLAASAIGGSAFGDDHETVGGWVNCDAYPVHCQSDCNDMNACLFFGEEDDCWAERLRLETCRASPPPGIIVIPPPPPPAPPPPAVGDPCGGIGVLDPVAFAALSGIPKRPYEDGQALFCDEDGDIDSTAWVSSPSHNACTVAISMKYNVSCWTGTPRPTEECDLASIHTHPYFTEADRGTQCHTHTINEYWAEQYNNGGMDFSGADHSADVAQGVDGYLGVSDRSCKKANRASSGGTPGGEGTCTTTPLPHTPWSAP